MQSFPLISEQQKFPRGMKTSHVFEVKKKKMISAESTMSKWYLFYTVALMNVDFS